MAHRQSNIQLPGPDPLAWSDEYLLAEHADVPPQALPVGRVNTPAVVARWMVSESLGAIRAAGAAGEGPDTGSSLTILEPAAGSGVIVGALAGELSRLAENGRGHHPPALDSIWAIDSDAGARHLAERRLKACLGRSLADWPHEHYRIGDALLQPELLPDSPIDLVIGNPPYLGLRHARRLPAFPQWRDRFGASEDLYVYFMRWAAEVVRPGGLIALLVPDGWLSLPGCESLRAELLHGCFELIVLLPRNTFAKHVNPCFFLWRKSAPAGAMRFADLRDESLGCETNLAELVRLRMRETGQEAFNASPRRRLILPSVGSPRLKSICELPSRRLAGVTPLAEVAHITDAGIHSRNCRHRLFFADCVKPGLNRLLQGRQIDRYAVHWDSPNAQFRWVDIHYKPRPNTLGRRRNGTPSVRDEYWNWQGAPALHEVPERILIRQTGDSIVAARCVQDHDTHYTDNTLFTVVLTETALDAGITYLYLLACLNSDILTRLYQYMSCERGRPQAQLKIGLLRELPFVWPPVESVRRIGVLACQMEAAARAKSHGSAFSFRSAYPDLSGCPGTPPTHTPQQVIDEHFHGLLARVTQDILPV